MNRRIGIVVQARTGSTRLPEKVVMDFCNNLSILEIIIKRLKEECPYPVVVATTTNSRDDLIVELCRKMECSVYRGSEDNVLDRFISASTAYSFSIIGRVCADNPLLDAHSFNKLFDSLKDDIDYVTYEVNGKPCIQTHYGFWGEVVDVSALKRIEERTKEKKYLEHVTNYIYTHPDEFKIKIFKLASRIINMPNVRLTVDTIQDFNNVKQIYKYLLDNKKAVSPDNVFKYLDDYPGVISEMEAQIKRNSK